MTTIYFNAGIGEYEVGSTLDKTGAKLYQFAEENLHENEAGDKAVIIPLVEFNAILVVLAMICNAFETNSLRIE